MAYVRGDGVEVESSKRGDGMNRYVVDASVQRGIEKVPHWRSSYLGLTLVNNEIYVAVMLALEDEQR